MEDPVFPDKSQVPKEADLAKAIGRAKRHWDNLKTHALDADPAATEEWKYYMKKTGWTFRVKNKRRNLLYMQPCGKGRFTVGLMFGKQAVQAAERSDLPDQVVETIRQSPQYPEGRMIRIEVTSAADVKIAKRLLAIKMDN